MNSTEIDEVNLPEGWKKCYSTKYKASYYFNTTNGSTSWTIPTIPATTSTTAKTLDINPIKPQSGSKRTIEEADERACKKFKGDDNIVKVAIVVPFRDLHKEQNRLRHLKQFIPEMLKYMNQSTSPYHLFIIEQSNDNRKFNRGKLLNIGFDIAMKQGYNVIIFHDVDLLPISPQLLNAYTTVPEQNHPVHIARLWKDRYSNNESYFGGIVKFSIEQFKLINGFPNNFWGWGGEDDEMLKRVKKVSLQPVAPQVVNDKETMILDMENMDLTQKLSFLKQHRTWKCMNKNELLAEHSTTWKENGLSNLTYHVLSEKAYCYSSTEEEKKASIVTVDVKENNHWTDLVCGVDETQLDESVEQVKKRFQLRNMKK
mmetsp:Transcript_13354/g.20020  ORF Transcript_13354/g.20020 Transcript_13354/m.20020 type:complete len:371 (+) Transcript_13354:35-1147(+)